MIESDFLKDNADLMKKLKRIPMFKSFSDANLKDLLKLSKIAKYKSGESIIKEGDFDNRIYFLVSGKATVVKHGETLSTLHRTGDVFGEMGIIDGSPRSASVYALEETVCLVTDASYIDQLSGNDRIAFSYVLYRIFSEILANRLRLTSNELIELKEEIKQLKQARNCIAK